DTQNLIVVLEFHAAVAPDFRRLNVGAGSKFQRRRFLSLVHQKQDRMQGPATDGGDSDADQGADEEVLGESPRLELGKARDGLRADDQPYRREGTHGKRDHEQSPLEPSQVKSRVAQSFERIEVLGLVIARGSKLSTERSQQVANEVTRGEHGRN